MVTLSALIVLAALFSHMSSILPDSPAPKAIEVFFFYYIMRLSFVFASHTILWRLRRGRMSNKKKSDNYDELTDYKVRLHSVVVCPLSSRKDSINRKMLPGLQKKQCISLKSLNKMALNLGLIVDFLFLGTFFSFIVIEKNRNLSVIDYK